MNDLVQMVFDLDEGKSEGREAESLSVRPLASGEKIQTFKVEGAPFYTEAVSRFDIVTGHPRPDGKFDFGEVIRRSGRSTYLVAVQEGLDWFDDFLRQVTELGGLSHKTYDAEHLEICYSIDVPQDVDNDRIYDVLSEAEWSNACFLREGCIGHPVTERDPASEETTDRGDPIDGVDAERLKQMLGAIGDGEWAQFKSLSDWLVNADDLRKQFEETSNTVDVASVNLRRDAKASTFRGVRMIVAQLPNKDPGKDAISLTIESKGEGKARTYRAVMLFTPIEWD